MKMPNLASWYHLGTWNLASDVHVGTNGPRAATASTRRTVSATPGSAARAGADTLSARTRGIGSRRRTMGGPPPGILRRERPGHLTGTWRPPSPPMPTPVPARREEVPGNVGEKFRELTCCGREASLA